MGLRKIIARLDYITSLVETVLIAIGALLLFVMMLTVSYSVFARYFFNIPAAWTLELSEYIMVALAFLSASWVLQNDGHVRVDLLVNAFNPKFQLLFNRITVIVAAITCALLFWFSLKTTIEHFQRDVLSYNIWIVPKYLVLLPIPLGSFFLTLRYIQKIFRTYDFY